MLTQDLHIALHWQLLAPLYATRVQHIVEDAKQKNVAIKVISKSGTELRDLRATTVLSFWVVPASNIGQRPAT